VLSVGVGSMPAGWNEFDSRSLVPIKPMQTLIDRLDGRLDRVLDRGESPQITIVGGGVAGVEISLCLQARLKRRYPDADARLRIVTSSSEIADGMPTSGVGKLRRILAQRSIDVVPGFRVVDVTDRAVCDRQGRQIESNVIVWATGAAPPTVLGRLNLPTDDHGFVATHRSLRTIAQAPVFAVGDSGTILDDPSPKAGVYAVRQAPVLWHNLEATLRGEPLSDYRPQHDFLKILNTGDGKAFLQYKGLSFHARWCLMLKTWIDTRFIASYQAGETAVTAEMKTCL
jgi:NADH dehydrogenase FAD-containing subunit